MGQGLPDLFREEGHEGVEQFQHAVHAVDEDGLRGLCAFAAFLETDLGDLDVPVAEQVPDEVVELGEGHAQFIAVDVLADLFAEGVELREDPLVFDGEVFDGGQVCRTLGTVEVHEDVTGGIPDLVAEVTGGLDLLLGIAHVVSGAVAGDEGEAEGICAVLVDDDQRVDAVAEGLRHLPALFIADDAVDEDRVEGIGAHLLHGGEDHAGDPEEDDIITRDQRIGREIVFQFRGLFRPAQRGEGPEGGGEPGVEGVLVLVDVFAAAVLALAGRAAGDGDLAAVVTVPGRDAVAPPELTGDAPVLDVLHPVEVGLVVAGRDELDLAGTDDVDGRVCQRFHLDEPLLRDAGLDDGAAAVAGADVVLHGLDADKVTLFLEVGHTGFPALFGGHADVLLRNVLVHAAVIGHDVDDR